MFFFRIFTEPQKEEFIRGTSIFEILPHLFCHESSDMLTRILPKCESCHVDVGGVLCFYVVVWWTILVTHEVWGFMVQYHKQHISNISWRIYYHSVWVVILRAEITRDKHATNEKPKFCGAEGRKLSLPKLTPSGKCNLVTNVSKLAKIEVQTSRTRLFVRKIFS